MPQVSVPIKMPQKKQSRKNTQVVKSMAPTDNDDIPSIVVKSQPSSRASTLSNKSVKVIELTPWEKIGMSEDEFNALNARVAAMYRENEKRNIEAALLADWDSLSYWLDRVEQLETSREKYNKKRGWSAEDIAEVEDIDKKIQECDKRIVELDDYDDYE